MFILDNKDHIEPGQNCRHEVNVLQEKADHINITSWTCTDQHVTKDIENRCHWMRTEHAAGGVQNRSLEVYRTGQWRCTEQVSGGVQNRSLEVYRTGHWRCIEQVTGGVQNRSVEVHTASPLVSSHRPNTELAAARTEHLELSVVVIPACDRRHGHEATCSS